MSYEAYLMSLYIYMGTYHDGMPIQTFMCSVCNGANATRHGGMEWLLADMVDVCK